MSWEMQSHMMDWVVPSLLAYLSAMSEGERIDWLTVRIQDNRPDVTVEVIRDDIARLGVDWAIECLAGYVERIATTDDGGHKFWTEPDGCVVVPWCSEEEYFCYYS